MRDNESKIANINEARNCVNATSGTPQSLGSVMGTHGFDYAAEQKQRAKVTAFQLASMAGDAATVMERAKAIYEWLTE